MINLFLKAKHWQLFILTFGVPLVFQAAMMWSMMSEIVSPDNAQAAFMTNYFTLFPLMMIVFMAVFFGWYWAVAVGLQEKVPETVSMKIKKFKVFFFIPIVYMFIFVGFLSVAMVGLLNGNPEPNMAIVAGLFAIIVPLHLFSMFCLFYCLYFVAKTIKTVELQRDVNFGDFVGEFFLIWFFPIGIWFIQPMINRMIEE